MGEVTAYTYQNVLDLKHEENSSIVDFDIVYRPVGG